MRGRGWAATLVTRRGGGDHGPSGLCILENLALVPAVDLPFPAAFRIRASFCADVVLEVDVANSVVLSQGRVSVQRATLSRMDCYPVGLASGLAGADVGGAFGVAIMNEEASCDLFNWFCVLCDFGVVGGERHRFCMWLSLLQK